MGKIEVIDKIVIGLNSENINPAALVLDTYEYLVKIYDKQEALELTKIISDCYYKDSNKKFLEREK